MSASGGSLHHVVAARAGIKRRWPTELIDTILVILQDNPGLHKTELGFRAAMNPDLIANWLRYLEETQLVLVRERAYFLTDKGALVLGLIRELFRQLRHRERRA